VGRRIGLSLGCLFLSAAASLGQDADQTAKAVRAVLDDQVAAWNQRDLVRFMKGYWEDEKLSFFSGNSKIAGWKATLERYQKKYQGEGKEMGKLAFAELSIEPLGTTTPWFAAAIAWSFAMKRRPESSRSFCAARLRDGRSFTITHHRDREKLTARTRSASSATRAAVPGRPRP
jgi:hypothetical protein